MNLREEDGILVAAAPSESGAATGILPEILKVALKLPALKLQGRSPGLFGRKMEFLSQLHLVGVELRQASCLNMWMVWKLCCDHHI